MGKGGRTTRVDRGRELGPEQPESVSGQKIPDILLINSMLHTSDGSNLSDRGRYLGKVLLPASLAVQWHRRHQWHPVALPSSKKPGHPQLRALEETVRPKMEQMGEGKGPSELSRGCLRIGR